MDSVCKKIENNNVYRWLERNLYLILFCLWFTAVYFNGINISRASWYSLNFYPYVIRLLKYLMLLYIVIFRKFSLKQWIVAGIVLILLYYTAQNAGDLSLFYCWLFILGCGEEDVDRVVKAVAYMLAVYVLTTAILALTGVLENIVTSGGRTRYALGFRHPNTLGFEVYIMALCLLFLSGKIFPSVLKFCVIGVLAVFVWIVPNSRTSAVCILLAMALFLFEYILNKSCDAVKKVVMYCMVTVAVIANIGSVILTVCYSPNGVLMQLNSLLSGRLSLGKAAFDEFGVSLWGQQVYFSDVERELAGLKGQLIVDCGYVNMLLRFGLVTYLLFSGLYIAAMFLSARKMKYKTVSILFLMALYAVSEKVAFLVTSNIFIVFMACLFFYDSDIRRKNQKTVCSHIISLVSDTVEVRK